MSRTRLTLARLELNSFPIAVTRLAEQQASVQQLSGANHRISRLGAEAGELHRVALGLMQDPLTGKVQVITPAVGVTA